MKSPQNTLYSYATLMILLMFSFTGHAENTVPDVLKPWVPWVLKGEEALKCPYINKSDFSEGKNHVCAWPSALTLDANNNGGTFSQSWQVLEESWLTLPGDSHNWPQQVTRNGKPAQVVSRHGKPSLLLPSGNYQISGQFDWSALPMSLDIPSAYAQVILNVNGQTVDFPKTVNGELWFDHKQVKQTEQDTTTVYVKRKLTDGPYIQLETRLTIEVSGKRREVPIGKVLPPGFEPTNSISDLPTFLDAQGVLHAKLQPGNWQVLIFAHAPATTLTWQRPPKTLLWPEQEVWAFGTDTSFRSGQLNGPKVIDASLADMPQEWSNLPTYVMQPSDVMRYTVQHRGKPLQQQNSLQLSRKMWLSFDNQQYAFDDNITGTMVKDWRFSMNTPYQLESGENENGAVLITTNGKNEKGVENRFTAVDFKARGTINTASNFPVSGWDSDFESVKVDLNLPPANRLFAVFGADKVSRSWLSGWSIWAGFIVLFAALLAGRTITLTTGLLTGIALILVYQEYDAPVKLILNLLGAIAIAKYQPFPSLKKLVTGYLTLSVIAVVGAALYFSAGQIRTMVHPQLEVKQQTAPTYYAYNEPTSSSSPQKLDMLLNQVKQDRSSGLERAEEKQFIDAPVARQVKQRYQSDALKQAGAGIPSWDWNSYTLSWTSPVAKGQQVQVIVLSQTQTTVFKAAGVLLLLLWLFVTLKSTLGNLLTLPKIKPVVTIALLCLFNPLIVEDLQAAPSNNNALPSQTMLQALQERLTESPECAPMCATINNLHVSIKGNQIELKMQIHSLHDTAVALPQSAFWRPQQLMVDGKQQNTLYKRKNAIYVKLGTGIFDVKVSGTIAPVDVFQLQFTEQPKHVTYQPSTAWDIVGINKNRLNGNTLEFVATAQKQQADTVQSTRYTTPPFVQVTRTLSFDQTWTVTTTVKRIAPVTGSLSVKIPLIKGEQITTSAIEVEKRFAQITIAAGSETAQWQSTLQRQPQINLNADNSGQISENWHITSSPLWHVKLSGLPMSIDELNRQSHFSATFYPYDGESLKLDLSRPTAVKGHIMAIDKAQTTLEQGVRTSQLVLKFDYRSTRGGEHTITLPKGYQIKDIIIDKKNHNLQAQGEQLTLPISPGKHSVIIQLRANVEAQTLLSAPTFNLNAPMSNITSQINLTGERWVLYTNGPVIGPAVVYWGELLVFVLLALALTRYPFSPLGIGSWLMLGIGLSFNNWSVLFLVAACFASLTFSKYRPTDSTRASYNLSQLFLFILSAVTLMTLVSAIPMSLLSQPDMGIVGNYSYNNQLIWFTDKSDGLMPAISVLSIPTLIYKGLMLLWVLWLSFSLLNWIKWGWAILGENDYWRAKPEPDPVEEYDDDDDADFNEEKNNNQENKSP